MLTGRYRKGQPLPDSLRVKFLGKQMSDEHRLDAVEQLIVVADQAGMPLTHLAMAFAVSHPGVTSAILGPRTMEHLDDLLASAQVVLSDEVLDQIDQIVPPGTDVGIPDAANYVPPALSQTGLRRRAASDRSVA
jgi:aryl-alcohol dehydrogenase (NADP+)